MREKRMTKAASRSLTRTQRADLKRLATMSDDAIDTRDTPEIRDWSGARRGVFYRPVKQQLTLRIDADVVAWFRRERPEGYQTQMNRVLRDYVQRRSRKRG